MSQPSPFFAMLARMRLIQRWGLMRNTRAENVQEHSLQVAMIAHALALISNRHHGGDFDADRVAVLGMFHDASEILTGDLPTPVKYGNDAIREAYKALERQAERRLLELLPADLREDYASLLDGARQRPAEQRLVKAADSLAGYLKCLEEAQAGNREFRRAEAVLLAKIESFYAELPAVRDFMRRYVPAFSLSLDDLSHTLGTDDQASSAG
ncbi:MAG: 5'-deoxynucleotidase [Stenotrophomonas sp.]|uniref:5'-deoxynucleotidase n=1 Tax=Stenotrophomonas sp. TaxID=69392 RepID=UPI0019AD03B9|nr:5'-deoxynucleotidase [Stenotrophomonas sp.]MBD3743393.1 5'-deoxynucleotidase [Stenotrophomonas sp.]